MKASLPDVQEDMRGLIVQNASPQAMGQALNSIADSATKGTDLDLSELSAHLGLDERQAEVTFNALKYAFQEQADAAVLAAGVSDVEAFYAWTKANHGAKLREAIMDQVHGKSTQRYRALAQQFARSGYEGSTIDADSFIDGDHAPGIETVTRNGKVLVRLNGVEMELRAAIRAGLVAQR